MDKNDTIGTAFKVYAGVVVGLGLIGMYLEGRSVQWLLPIFLLQLLAQGLITYEGMKSERYNSYVLFMGFVIPFIAVMFIGWLNTF